jgi:hypothetical protein
MRSAAEQELADFGQTCTCQDHDFLIHELSRRLNDLWRYDSYVVNADWRDELLQFWCDMKMQEQQNIQRLKGLLIEEVRNDRF